MVKFYCPTCNALWREVSSIMVREERKSHMETGGKWMISCLQDILHIVLSLADALQSE